MLLLALDVLNHARYISLRNGQNPIPFLSGYAVPEFTCDKARTTALELLHKISGRNRRTDTSEYVNVIRNAVDEA